MPGGAKRSRTADLDTASVALYQLSYGPSSQPLEGQSIEVEPSLAAFLRGRTPAATERVVWPRSAGEFDFSAYLTPDPPPLELVVSSRAILVRGSQVLAFDSPTGTTHVIPGGRREPGESLEDTLTREIREEIGCEIAPGPRPLGFIQLHDRLAPRDGSPYPYPDSLWVVYAATALPGGTSPIGDEWVRDPRFVDVGTLSGLNVSPVELVFVEAAMA